ncbi:twin-arginine translocation pathway signal protein [Puteibacter caeruleilacunae]|nr:twin-arginine translocation pathway signal protein [Puteibacter caeruleilacunae]
MNKIAKLGLLACLGIVAHGNAVIAKERPNVVLILADDLGYGDLSINGCPDINTPNIDRLAREGVQFTNYYTSGPVCTPTRCALMTGRYQARFKDMEGAFYLGVDNIGLPRDGETLPKALKDVGYSTGMVGKWHLGELPYMQPQRQGFDNFFGFFGGNIDYFRHCDKNQNPDLYENGKPVTDGKYMTDLITDKSIEFIDNHYKEKDPFFLYVAYNAPHWPYQGPDDAPCLADGSNWMKGTRNHMVNMIESLDTGVGRILEELKNRGLDENTLVIFSSDNGGDKLARNAPFSGKKGLLRDGGIHVPLYMRWTNAIKPKQQCNQVAITMDISCTVLSFADANMNEQTDGIALLKSNGRPVKSVERALCWRNGKSGEQAVRKGKWKYLKENKGKSEYLFNLDEDVAESTDLKEQFPKIFEELKSDFKKWEDEMPYKQSLFGFELRDFYAKKVSNED